MAPWSGLKASRALPAREVHPVPHRALRGGLGAHWLYAYQLWGFVIGVTTPAVSSAPSGAGLFVRLGVGGTYLIVGDHE